MRWLSILFLAASVEGAAFAAPYDATSNAPSSDHSYSSDKDKSSDKMTTKSATGVVKSLDQAKHSITITVDNKDWTFDTSQVALPSQVAIGSSVDISYSGKKLYSLTQHGDVGTTPGSQGSSPDVP